MGFWSFQTLEQGFPAPLLDVTSLMHSEEQATVYQQYALAS